MIAGHRDTHFRFLQNLVAGDVIIVQTADAVSHDYQISRATVVTETETEYLADSGETTLTLITCYPFAAIVPGGPLRYIVIATPAATPRRPGYEGV